MDLAELVDVYDKKYKYKDNIEPEIIYAKDITDFLNPNYQVHSFRQLTSWAEYCHRITITNNEWQLVDTYIGIGSRLNRYGSYGSPIYETPSVLFTPICFTLHPSGLAYNISKSMLSNINFRSDVSYRRLLVSQDQDVLSRLIPYKEDFPKLVDALEIEFRNPDNRIFALACSSIYTTIITGEKGYSLDV